MECVVDLNLIHFRNDDEIFFNAASFISSEYLIVKIGVDAAEKTHVVYQPTNRERAAHNLGRKKKVLTSKNLVTNRVREAMNKVRRLTGDQARPRCDARVPPRDRDRGRRPASGLPLGVAGPQVLRRAGGLLRVARGRPDRGLAPDHGAHVCDSCTFDGRGRRAGQTFEGSFSLVSTPTFPSG